MHSSHRLDKTEDVSPLEHVNESRAAGDILTRVFNVLDRAEISYCVLHGYESYPERVRSDVDCIIDPSVEPRRLCELLYEHRAEIGAAVVRWRDYHIVLAWIDAQGLPSFLTLDLSVEAGMKDLSFYTSSEVLKERRRFGQFSIPAAAVDFGSYLARSIEKGRLDDERTRRLDRLFKEDPGGCEEHIARWWKDREQQLLVSAARSGKWGELAQHLGALRSQLRKEAMRRFPLRFLMKKLDRLVGRVKRVWRPDGLYVAFLGPDGAGKSTVIKAVGPLLAPVFSSWSLGGFAASPLRLFRRRRPQGPTNQPHALPPRSAVISVLRAGYWLLYYTLGYVNVRVRLARSTLVLNDRDFIDILVDPRRYRYGGPAWLVRFIWRLIPKPDLIVLLDAPAEVLQARKQEVPFEETARQRRAYLSLIATQSGGHVVCAAQPPKQVIRNVSEIIIGHLATRVAHRLGRSKGG